MTILSRTIDKYSRDALAVARRAQLDPFENRPGWGPHVKRVDLRHTVELGYPATKLVWDRALRVAALFATAYGDDTGATTAFEAARLGIYDVRNKIQLFQQPNVYTPFTAAATPNFFPNTSSLKMLFGWNQDPLRLDVTVQTGDVWVLQLDTNGGLDNSLESWTMSVFFFCDWQVSEPEANPK